MIKKMKDNANTISTSNSNSTLSAIERKHYVATPQDVEHMAREYVSTLATGARVNSGYLRVLIVAAQGRLGKPPNKRQTRINQDAQLGALDTVHNEYYPAVLIGITTEDIKPDDTLEREERQRRTLERNRRSIFARTAKATLDGYVKAGGDIRTLKSRDVSKRMLQDYVQAREAVETEGQERQTVAKAETKLLRWLTKLAKVSTTEAMLQADKIRGMLAEFIQGLTIEEEKDYDTDTEVIDIPSVSRIPRDMHATHVLQHSPSRDT